MRCTFGWPIFADHVPARSDILVERLEPRGALVYAKSNTPEFGKMRQRILEPGNPCARVNARGAGGALHGQAS